MSTLPEAKTPSPRTVYRVLRQISAGPDGSIGRRWEDLGAVEASGPASAIKEFAGETEGVYAATPDRSWHVLRMNVATKRVVTTERVEQSVTGDAAA